MRLVVTKTSLKLFLRWTQRVLFGAAIAMLAYCGFVVMDAWTFQKEEGRQLERLLTERKQANGKARRTAALGSPEYSSPVMPGLIGRIEIPRLGLSVIVMEGTSRTTLRRAAGHISGTALPGQAGNTGISGHRDTFFRPLQNIRQNDIITLTTLLGQYRYRVVSMMVVSRYDVEVLDPTGSEILTLVTCYPFYFVGSAPSRFIVRAERV